MSRERFLALIRAKAKTARLPFRWNAKRGSGSHGTVYVGERFDVLADRDYGPGLRRMILRKLGLPAEDA